MAEFNGTIQMLVAHAPHGGRGLKLCQFFRYAAAAGQRRAQIWMSPSLELPPESPWRTLLEEGAVVATPHPRPGLLLLSDAADWRAAAHLYGAAHTALPRLQLLMGADLRVWGHGARRCPAIRVAIGPEVAQAVTTAALFAEPLHVLPVGLDPDDLPSPAPQRRPEVLILGWSHPALGLAVRDALLARGVACQLALNSWALPRWQQALAEAPAAVVLAPPAGQPSLGLRRLAAMALQTPLVVDPSIAREPIAVDGRNALVRPADPQALAEAAASLVGAAAAPLRRQLIDGGLATLVRHRRARERLEFEQLLEGCAEHWRAARRCHAADAATDAATAPA